MSELHPALRQDCIEIGHFPLCRLLLMRDANYPWFILVPDRDNITEIFQLAPADRVALMNESCLLAETLQQVFSPDKLNLAALGNIVPQLHIHHIVRYRDDPAWPGPVWGKLPTRHYAQGEAERMIRLLGDRLQDQADFLITANLPHNPEANRV